MPWSKLPKRSPYCCGWLNKTYQRTGKRHPALLVCIDVWGVAPPNQIRSKLKARDETYLVSLTPWSKAPFCPQIACKHCHMQRRPAPGRKATGKAEGSIPLRLSVHSGWVMFNRRSPMCGYPFGWLVVSPESSGGSWLRNPSWVHTIYEPSPNILHKAIVDYQVLWCHSSLKSTLFMLDLAGSSSQCNRIIFTEVFFEWDVDPLGVVK